VSAFVEQLAKQGYQFCLIDPEGDYEALRSAQLRHREREADIKVISQALADPDENLIINLLAVRWASGQTYSRECCRQWIQRFRTGAHCSSSMKHIICCPIVVFGGRTLHDR